MITKIKLIAIIENNDSTSTIYFFHKKHKVVLPIYVETENFDTPKSNYEIATDIYTTVKVLTASLEASLHSITIYKCIAETYYVYLNIDKENNLLEINIKLEDAIIIVQRYKLPIYINKELLISNGIKVTKSLIRDAI